MGMQTTEYHSETEVKNQSKATKNSACLSTAEKQEFLESLKKFGIDLT